MGPDGRTIRVALAKFTESIAQEGNSSLSGVPPASTFVPPSHARALDATVTLVEGIRGAGKSFWWSALFSEPHLNFAWKNEEHGWVLPNRLARDEEAQEHIFISLAGSAMGKGPSGIKRGKPYSWLVNHLVDGRAQVSPHSFLSAIGTAAGETAEDFASALSPRAIQDGVQQASRIRVDELIREDYPWIGDLMEPLKGLTVPCAVEDIAAVWLSNGVLDRLQKSLKGAKTLKLPPRRLEDGPRGVLDDLQELGLVQILRDDRVQMPDVYRIAFGLGRRGGVKPLV